MSLVSAALAGRFFATRATRETLCFLWLPSIEILSVFWFEIVISLALSSLLELSLGVSMFFHLFPVIVWRWEVLEDVDRGEKPSPSVTCPSGLLIFQFYRSYGNFSSPVPYLDTGTDVGFILCCSSPWKSGWGHFNCFHMVLLTGKSLPNLYLILYTHL